jgi:NTP pyrophosphatase (non-canonical NTP hydrolase)
MKNFEELDYNITNWAHNKGLIVIANHPKQFMKVMEELGETARSVLKDDKEGIIDGIGDTFVTLIILSRQLGLDPVECLNVAWNEIKDRTGKTVDGTFIKD